ncbi:hypothetical protein [Spongiimicrobium sp. 3-5]|uniref:hypothetical protein n=1 Tax=Spongiimicrobium sp. 3-5 TaxID=3332596 RepID=UPI00397E99FE
MKNLIIILLLALVSTPINAQKIIEKNIDYKNQTIHLDVKFAENIEVKTWDKSAVYFKADLNTHEGKYLDFYELHVEEGNSRIDIVSKAEPLFEKFQEERYKKNPDNKRKYYNCGYEYEFNYTLYVPKNATFAVSSINGNLESELVEGDFTADLINGNIEIKKYVGNLDLSTINGEIDLKMINTDLVAETIHGNIYADEKLSFKTTDRHVGQKVEGHFNNAASRLRLNTINGNMYLRL